MQLQYYSEVMPDLSPCFRALIIISTYTWILTTYKTLSVDRERLVYQIAHGILFDVGSLNYKQIMSLGILQKNNS